MDTRKIIDYAYEDDAKSMRDELYASIADKVSAHLEQQKQDIASRLFNQPEVESEVE
jgi:hypothetical protein